MPSKGEDGERPVVGDHLFEPHDGDVQVGERSAEVGVALDGIVVHWAADADEMNRTVWELISASGTSCIILSRLVRTANRALSCQAVRGASAMNFAAALEWLLIVSR